VGYSDRLAVSAATVTTTAAAMEPTTAATTVESATAEATASTVEATASTVEAAHAAAVTASEPIAMESAGAAATEAARVAAAEAVIAVTKSATAVSYAAAAVAKAASIPKAPSVEAPMEVPSATVESMTPISVVPGAGPDEEAAEEPARAIEAVRRARIRVIPIVAIRAGRCVAITGTVVRTVALIVVARIVDTHANAHLCLGAWNQRQWRGHQAQREYPSKEFVHIASPIRPPLLLLTEWPSWCVGKPAVSAASPNQYDPCSHIKVAQNERLLE
jgi:hypothetical protein